MTDKCTQAKWDTAKSMAISCVTGGGIAHLFTGAHPILPAGGKFVSETAPITGKLALPIAAAVCGLSAYGAYRMHEADIASACEPSVTPPSIDEAVKRSR